MIKNLKAATDTLGELFLIYTVLILTAACVFSFAEGTSIGEAIYWAGITATSVGYGDVTPATLIGRITGLALAHASILFVLPILIARFATNMIENPHEFTDEEQQYILDTCKTVRHGMAMVRTMPPPEEAPPPEVTEQAEETEAYFKPKTKEA